MYNYFRIGVADGGKIEGDIDGFKIIKQNNDWLLNHEFLLFSRNAVPTAGLQHISTDTSNTTTSTSDLNFCQHDSSTRREYNQQCCLCVKYCMFPVVRYLNLYNFLLQICEFISSLYANLVKSF